MKRLLISSGIIVLLAALASLYLRHHYEHFLETPLAIPAHGHVLLIEKGSSAQAIVERLEGLGFTEASWEWKLLMRLEPPTIRAGEYRLEPSLRPPQLLHFLSTAAEVQYRFTLVEGWAFSQLLDALGRDEVLVQTLDENDSETRVLTEVLSEVETSLPEGWFLPETYQFTRGDTDLDLLKRSHQAMVLALEQAWLSRVDDLPLASPYELLILASIIEKETALDSERAEIAGVFIRRLKLGMRLQTDPTVIYGMGDAYDGNIRRKDLRTDTAYNTYTRSGLPPTPIAMPGKSSLQAAAQPSDGDTLYFVADGKGGHTFSVTLKEHQAAVNKLIGKG